MQDFRECQEMGKNLLRAAVKDTRSFAQATLVSPARPPMENTDPDSKFCDGTQGQNLIRSEHILNSVPLFIEKNLKITKKMIEQAGQLTRVLADLATNVFDLNINVIHIFYDSKGRK